MDPAERHFLLLAVFFCTACCIACTAISAWIVCRYIPRKEDRPAFPVALKVDDVVAQEQRPAKCIVCGRSNTKECSDHEQRG
jgi:hypothetical protein